MAIYIGGKKVQESGGKYKPQGVKKPKGRYTKSTVNPSDKFEGAKDRARANQAYLEQSDRDFKKKIQAVKDGDYLEAAEQMRQSRWHKQVTNRADRLISRMKGVSLQD